MASVRQNKFKATLGITVLASAIILGFQNCSPMPEMAQLPSEENLAAIAPFPYDVDLDTFAYMSCSDREGLDKSTYFTIKMGALRPGSGVFLSSEFRSFADTYKLTQNKITEILDDNTFSRDAKLQVSVRSKANLRGTPVGSGSLPQRVGLVWSSLSVPPLATNIADTDETIKVNVGPGGYLMSSVLLSAFYEEQIEDYIYTSGIPVIGFQGAFYKNVDEREHRLVSPYDVLGVNINAIYGKGFLPQLASPRYGGSRIGHGKRVIGTLTVQRVDGASSSPSVWSCVEQAEYRIVPYDERATAGCDINAAAPTGTTSNEAKAYAAAYALLIGSVPNGSARWKIDQGHRCIIDLQSSQVARQCYKTIADYGALIAPIQWGTNPTTDVCGGASGKQCPQYMSICWK